jgi:hypothetical protein
MPLGGHFYTAANTGAYLVKDRNSEELLIQIYLLLRAFVLYQAGEKECGAFL